MSLLADLGLNPAEIRVFVALQRIGQTGVSALIKESGVASANIYPVIGSLAAKGLLVKVVRSNHHLYAPSDPGMLLVMHDEKVTELSARRKELEGFIGSMSRKEASSDRRLVMLEDIAGIKAAVTNAIESLPEGGTYYVLGAPAMLSRSLHGFFSDVHRRRIAKRIKFRIIYSKNNIEFAEDRKTSALTKIKYCDFGNNIEFAIYNDVVQIISFGGEPYVVEVKDGGVADAMRFYFETIWAVSETKA
ncbi:MAG: helix-turn-helix domain-containing protein [Nanoarchaeota archaeon]